MPVGWHAIQASATWDGTGAPSAEEPEADQIVRPDTARAFAYAAPTTLDLAGYVAERIEANFADHGDMCPAVPDVQDPIEIGGEPSMLVGWDCGILINQAWAVHDGTGYLFGFRDQAVDAATDPADRAAFLELLNSVHFPG